MALVGSAGDFRSTVLSVAGYKPGQGKWARGLTFAAIAAIALYGWWGWRGFAINYTAVGRYLVPSLVVAAGLWLAYRLVHYPRFADFLIATEAEMNKVSWPSWRDVRTATIVVLALAALLAAFLFGVDWLWQRILLLINVLQYATRALGDG